MIIVIEKDCTLGEDWFVAGEVIEAPTPIAEWLIHNGLATVARNWRWEGESTAPKPAPTRFL